MFRMLHLTDLSKGEADKLCDDLGLCRKEVTHASRGWSYTSIYNGNDLCGEITARKVGIPFTVSIDLDRINKSQRLSLIK